MNQELLNYIKSQFQAGVPGNEIKKNLLAQGWEETAIDEALKAAVQSSGASSDLSAIKLTTEKDYPIRGRWVVKSSLHFILGSVIISAYFLFDPSFGIVFGKGSRTFLFYAIIVIIPMIWRISALILRRIYFHYALEEKFLTVRQGIISKQQRQLPYGVIQDLFVQQGLLDRIFGIASLRVENAAQGSQMAPYNLVRQRQGVEVIGSAGNVVNIPGLSKNDAETLKGLILQKMKQNPVEGTSGL